MVKKEEIIFYFNEVNLEKILPIELLNILYEIKPIEYGQTVNIIDRRLITYELYVGGEVYIEEMNAEIEDIINIIIKILYYYPKVTKIIM